MNMPEKGGQHTNLVEKVEPPKERTYRPKD